MSDQATTQHHHLQDPDAPPEAMRGPFPVVPCVSCEETLTLVPPELPIGEVLDAFERVGLRVVVFPQGDQVIEEWHRE